MCFSEMVSKEKSAQYTSLDLFVYDFKLICENCMKYNAQNTVYYKEAKRILREVYKLNHLVNKIKLT